MQILGSKDSEFVAAGRAQYAVCTRRAVHGQRHFTDDKLCLLARPALQLQRDAAKQVGLVERSPQSADEPVEILEVGKRGSQGAQRRGTVQDPGSGQLLGRRDAGFLLAHGRWAWAGRWTWNVVPLPSSLVTSIAPWWYWMMRRTIASPNPMPRRLC